MNIQISQITNGFIVAIAVPEGQTATHFKTFGEVVTFLGSIEKKPENVTELPKRD